MTSAKALLLAFVLVLGMIVSPVSALGYEIVEGPLMPGLDFLSSVEQVYNLSVDLAPDGYALRVLRVDIPTDTTVNFTLWYGGGESVSGWMEYRQATDCWGLLSGEFCQYSGVSIGSDVDGSSNRGLQEIGRIDITTYARNWTSDQDYTVGFLVWDTTYRIPEGHQAYFEIPNGTDNIVYKFNVVSTKPVSIGWEYNTRDKINVWVKTTPGDIANDWITIAKRYADAAIGFILSVGWILKFFFVDNLLLIIALWISVSMAYSAISSPNIFKFYQKFFGLQRALVDFVISLWRVLWEIINYLVQIFVKWL
jgi:hypothetical protein